MITGTIISNDRQAREVTAIIDELDKALSSDQVLKAIVTGLPHEVIDGVRRSLVTERHELEQQLTAFQATKAGDYGALKERAGNDLGAFLIAARLIQGLSQKELARKLGLREQAIQRWEAEKYRNITLANYQKVAQMLGVQWDLSTTTTLREKVGLTYDVKRDDLAKVLRHAREKGWLSADDTNDETATAMLIRLVGDHVNRYGTPSLLRTGLNVVDHAEDWSLLSWKAQVTRRAESIVAQEKPRFRPMNLSWLVDLVRLSPLADGPKRAVDLLLQNGVVVIIEPQIPGMAVDGAAFLVEETPVIGMTLLRDTVDNFWFTLMHEVGHVILHYRTRLASGFFDDGNSSSVDGFEEEANRFASNLLIPDEIWTRSPVRIAKTAEPVEKLAAQLGIHPAIIFGRIRMERNDYKIFSNKIGRGLVRAQFTPQAER